MNYSNWNSVPEYLVDKLRKLIASDEYKVGDRFFTEMEVCQKFNVGRSSVREAFRMLRAIGLIEIERGKGTFIVQKEELDANELTRWYSHHHVEVQDLIEVRLCVETFAVKKAVDRIQPEQLEILRDLVERGKKAVEEKSITDMVVIDEEFHYALVEASGNRYLAEINRSIQKAASEYRGKTFGFAPFFPYAAESHARLLKYIESRDSISAIQEISEHILTALYNINEITKASVK